MKRKCLSILLLLILCAAQAFASSGDETVSAFVDVPGLLRPGKAERISFYSALDSPVDLMVDLKGSQERFSVFGQIPARRGMNNLTWNGLDNSGQPLQEGEYSLILRQGEVDAAHASLSVGPPGPRILSFTLSDSAISPGTPWYLSAEVNMPGTLRLSLEGTEGDQTIALEEAEGGTVTLGWDGTLEGNDAEPGDRQLKLTLTDATGFSSNVHYILVSLLEAPTLPVNTSSPDPTSGPPDRHFKPPGSEPLDPSLKQSGYWALPAGDFNEDAIWKAMMQPITVLTGGDQRETYKLRVTPDKSLAASNIVGEITFVSQGVNVLEHRPDGWSLVETFNSSYGPKNKSRPGYGDTDDLIRGYVRTENLQVKVPRDDYGLLIDKLKQRLYVFKDGKLFTELVISTGLPTTRQPWNETPSGEYLMVSRVGEFNAGNLVCAMAMRINGGALIHEVPYILNEATQYKDYSIQERQLGDKASHGCIRVQRKNNADGINMTWLWNNIKVNTKVLVWDDAPGRYYEYPPDNLALFFNPVGGKYYHMDRNCPSIKDRYLPLEGSLSYAELDNDAFRKLEPCFACTPPLRKAEIEAINHKNGF